MALTTDLVSSSIVARQREPEGLRKMMVVSGIGHVVAIAAFVVLPWLVGAKERQPDVAIVVSLDGPPGPQSGGMTGLAGQAVQKVEPTPELPRPAPARPPAAKTPEMVEPTKATPRRPTQKQSSPSQRQAPPTTGEAIRPGQAPVDTRSTSPEAGLSTGSGGTGASNTLANFCDPQYLGQMVSMIHRNWQQRQTVVGKPVIRFVIQRDGTLTDITIRQPTGYVALDQSAQRAVILTRAVPPLPACYPHADFAVNLTFEYIR